MVRVIVKKKLDCDNLLGQFCDQSTYDELITENTDLYVEAIDGTLTEENIIFKYRQGTFSEEEQALAYEGLREAAVESQNRGLAAGPRGEFLGTKGRGGRDWVQTYHIEVLSWLLRPDNILVAEETLEQVINKWKGKDEADTRGQVWLRSEVCKKYPEYHGWFEKWLAGLHNLPREEQRKEAEYVRSNYISDTNYAQSVMSGIAGYFDRYPRIPFGRATSYTEKQFELFVKCYPYVSKLDAVFKRELPSRWKQQRTAADKIDKRFTIDGSVYTTLTVNHNWRTAAHRDAGDFNEGFSNITAFTGPGGLGWKGGEFILPEYRVAIQLRPRDLLLVNNHAGIHANAPLIGEDNDRLTIVAYLREKMLNLKSWEYETLRKQFVEERRVDKSHPMQRPLWNGVSPDMWASQEWADYLKKHNMKDEDGVVGEVNSLEEFF
jgi:hypothetical protein